MVIFKSTPLPSQLNSKQYITLLLLYTLVTIFYFIPDKSNIPGYNRSLIPVITDSPQIKYTCIEDMPQFKGDIKQYINAHLQYPDSARKEGIQGRVVVQFIINENGSVSDAKVVRGIGYGCDQEALRIISTMPYWQPGMQNGKAVKVTYSIAVPFILD